MKKEKVVEFISGVSLLSAIIFFLLIGKYAVDNIDKTQLQILFHMKWEFWGFAISAFIHFIVQYFEDEG